MRVCRMWQTRKKQCMGRRRSRKECGGNQLEWWPDYYPGPRQLLAKSPTLRAVPWLAPQFSASGPIGLSVHTFNPCPLQGLSRSLARGTHKTTEHLDPVVKRTTGLHQHLPLSTSFCIWIQSLPPCDHGSHWAICAAWEQECLRESTLVHKGLGHELSRAEICQSLWISGKKEERKKVVEMGERDDIGEAINYMCYGFNASS